MSDARAGLDAVDAALPHVLAPLESAPDCYLILSPDLTIIGVTDAYLRATMTQRDAIVGRGLFEVFPDNPTDPAADGVGNLRASLDRVRDKRAADGMPIQKYDVRMADGSFEEKYWKPLNTPVLSAEGGIAYIIHRVDDVTDKVHEQRAAKVLLDESAQNFAVVADNIPQLAWMADAKGWIFWYNRRWLDYTGTTIEEMQGWGWQKVHHPDHVDRVVARIKVSFDTGVDWEDTFPLRGTDGQYRWFLSRARPIRDPSGAIVRWFGSNTDVTELRETEIALQKSVRDRTNELIESKDVLLDQIAQREAAEDKVRQLQKMEAVGQLTGGIAHDFNNMLAVIIGGLNLAERRIAKGEDASKLMQGALEAAGRAATLTHRLLAFSRQLPLSPEPVDANRLVSAMSELLRRSLGETTVLETVLAGGLWKAHADINQLENSILNLAVNARDAMPGGGKLTIETSNCHLDDDYVRTHIDVTAGQYVMIAVTDTGTGMTPEVIAKAMEPFFTTKPVGKGTGLGLSQVYGFLKQSRGHVKIYSEVGHGTTVKVYLPRLYGVAEVAAPVSEHALSRGASTEVILVVEDEVRIREVSTEALRELGYTVLHAASAVAALKILEGHPQIVLLFTDVVMPDMNGRQLADAALKMRPNLKVLYTTGYTRNAVVHNGVLDPGVNLLAKPFTLDQLARKVREVLS